ncbi:MAG TPA: radical SAM protein [Anaerolineales bacterium]|nr:radical SAM protein [Anaerolineales bacterium]
MFTYLQNLIRLARGNFTLSPRLAVYYVTMQCNLNCTYCEDFGSRRNQQVTPAPPLEDAKRILNVIRSGMDRLWLTGGEPLMYPQILDLLTCARHDLKFREISLITNGTLLSQHIDLLPFLDRLVVSLDAIDSQTLNTVSVPQMYANDVIENVRAAAFLQKTHNFQLIINAVITPETLPGMDKLLEFCTENKVHISISPQSVNNMPRYELVTSLEYRAFIEKVIRLKKQGAVIFGSFSYFNILLDQTPYECYPTLIPRILPDGWLTYPCRPMEKAGGEQGGRPVNLLNVGTWDEAWKLATKLYGDVPTSCVSCFQQCYAEPSLMQRRPLEYLLERLRGNDVSAYSPG